jgi:hypothetical protein
MNSLVFKFGRTNIVELLSFNQHQLYVLTETSTVIIKGLNKASSSYLASNDTRERSRWVNLRGLGRKWSRLHPRYHPEIRLEGLRKTAETSFRIIGILAEIRTGHLTDASENHYHLSHFATKG